MRDGLAEQGDGDRRERNARLIAKAFGYWKYVDSIGR